MKVKGIQYAQVMVDTLLKITEDFQDQQKKDLKRLTETSFKPLLVKKV